MAADDRVSAELAAIRELADRLLPLGRPPGLLAEQVAEKAPRLLAAVEAVLKVHPPVPVYEVAWHGHVPSPAGGFALHCGHPGTALEGDRHAESDEGDWICLDQLINTACGGCRGEAGEPADFANCATRADITRALTGEDGTQ